MSHPDLHHRVIAILSDVFQVELAASLEDLTQDELEEWDSFNHLRLVDELETVFQITLDDEEIPEMTSLQKVKILLQRHDISSA